MADVLLQIGLDVSEAKRGHDQIIAYNNDIAASFGKVTAAQNSSAAQFAQAEQKKTEAVTRSAKERISVEERAAAAIMAGYVRQGQAMGGVGQAAAGLGSQMNNTRGIVSQFGLQLTDMAIVSQMGSQAIGQMGIQVGQFLGVLGPTGAIAGAAVTMLGVLGGAYWNLSKNTEAATEEQERYNKAIEEGWSSIDRYNQQIDKMAGRPSSWRKEQEALSSLNLEIAKLETRREQAQKGGLFFSNVDERKEIQKQLEDLYIARRQLQTAPEETQQLRGKEILEDMAKARQNELEISRLANNERERAAKILEAEIRVRDKLKSSGLTPFEVEAQAKLEGQKAGTVFDLEAQKKAREDAERERERAADKSAREAKQAQDARDRAIKSGNEYIASLAHQREALGMTNRDAAIFRAGLEEERRLQQGNIKETEEVYHTKVRLAKEAAAALYDEQEARGKVLSQAQIRDMASRMSPGIAASANIELLTKYRDELMKLGVTEQEIADAIIDANIKKLESSREWTDGATAAIMRYSRNASNYGQMAGQAVTSSFTAMENALVGFSSGTKTAADAFRDMATSIIQDIVRMQVRANITGPLSGMLSGAIGQLFRGGLGGNDGFGSVGYGGEYGGGSYEAVTGQMAGSMGFFASGTDSAPRGMAIVGEEGPELVQLGGGERIYPAGQTRAILNSASSGGFGASGGGAVVNVEVFDQRSGGEPIDVETQMGEFGPIVRIIARDEANRAVQNFSKGGGLTNQMRADYNLRQPAVNRG